MSNLKLVAGTVKRRGIAIAAAVAVAGGSFATANYAMAVEAEPTFEELEAEFSGTEAGNTAAKTAFDAANAVKDGKSVEEVQKILQAGLWSAAGQNGAGFTREELNDFDQSQLNDGLKTAAEDAKNTLQEKNGSKAEQPAAPSDTAPQAPVQNPVAPLAPVPGQKAPEKAGDQTDVEKALAHTKQEALEKLKGFTSLTQQQKDAYMKAVNEATQVYQVEAAFEIGEAKNTANKAAKEATNFVGKALARTKQLALKQLDGMTGLNHEQKREARNKIVAAKQVFEVEAAFHAAEKLNKAAK